MAGKNIVILADGTWNSPENSEVTNVVQLARAIAPRTPTGNAPQVVFYDWGVGSDGSRLWSGLTGAGIEKNIVDGYRFLVHNYEPGDALYFFGFSRGAYTVRSLAGLIRQAGILRREHEGMIPEAYRLYRERSDDSHPKDPRATAFRALHAHADRTEIDFVGVWDTVGRLGIPLLHWGAGDGEAIPFHDVKASSIIRCARHAVAIDERRVDYVPTLWEPKPGMDIQQVWFAGAHSDVGGGYAEQGLSNCALRWIIAEAEAVGLAFVAKSVQAIIPDPLGALHDELVANPLFVLRGSRMRSIEGPVHVSVRQRWEADVGNYQKSRALAKLLASVNGDWGRIEVVPW